LAHSSSDQRTDSAQYQHLSISGIGSIPDWRRAYRRAYSSACRSTDQHVGVIAAFQTDFPDPTSLKRRLAYQ
jgi:hypothetical protein